MPDISDPRTPSTSRRGFLAGSAGVGAGLGSGIALSPGGAAHAASVFPGEDWPDGPGRRNSPQRASAELEAILEAIDPARIEASVRTLVSFGTRHTLSSQDDPERGIGAARDWLFAEFSRYAEASGGRMTVEKQTYVQQPANRIPVATPITNVIATLRGSTEPDRVYVISGHYDSRVTS